MKFVNANVFHNSNGATASAIDNRAALTAIWE